MSSSNCTVISYVPFSIEEQKPTLVPGRFVLPASKQEKPETLIVGDSFYHVYIDENRAPMKQICPATKVAESIVNDYVNSQIGMETDATPALFFVEGEVPKDKILDKYARQVSDALASQKRWLINMCKIADNDWQRYHQHNVISQFQRVAAEYIGWRPEEHEWMAPATTQESRPCPACRLSATKGTVICSNCKCILDPEAYKNLKFAQ